MNTLEAKTTETEADLATVIDHLLSGTPLAPEIARRVRERLEQATEELRRKHGTLNVAVNLIREIRDQP